MRKLLSCCWKYCAWAEQPFSPELLYLPAGLPITKATLFPVFQLPGMPPGKVCATNNNLLFKPTAANSAATKNKKASFLFDFNSDKRFFVESYF